jgi:hypothetical protein
MKNLKLFLVATIATIAMLVTSCSKSDDNDSSSSCNDIVCGGSGNPVTGVYYIFRGTLNPDTCGETQLTVNKATFDFYKAKWDLNPEGYACWEGLK